MNEGDPYVTMRRWYERAQIEYAQQYMALYASFNTWYRVTTGKTNDREALNILRHGNGVWASYQQGDAMYEMSSLMKLLVELTQREPLSYATPH